MFIGLKKFCVIKRKRKGVVKYFAKWKGYPDKFNSWVAEKDILKL